MNNREAMQEAFEAFMANDEKFPDGCNMTERVFNAGYQAALASQAQQEQSSNLNHSDIALLKQWFNAVQDLNPKYLNEGDFQLLAKLQSQAQQEPSKDIHEAITLLSAVFDAWENGTDCYDDFDGVSGSFIGKAFNLDDEIFKRCCDLLNRVNPPRNVSQAQQSQWISVEDQFPDHRNDVLCFVVSNHGDTAIKSSHLNPAMTGFYVDYEFDEPIETVTHWMPLPPAPEGDKQ